MFLCSKRYGLNLDDLTGFYESLGFEVFLQQGGNNLMILKDTYKTGGETKNKIMENKIKFSKEEQKDFNFWKQDGNVSKNEDGSYSTQDAQWTNRLKDLDALKEYYFKEFLNGSRYAGGGTTSKLKVFNVRDIKVGDKIYARWNDSLQWSFGIFKGETKNGFEVYDRTIERPEYIEFYAQISKSPPPYGDKKIFYSKNFKDRNYKNYHFIKEIQQGNYKKGGRTMQNIAKKQARKDIKTHLYRPQFPDVSSIKPSEKWARYELPYDTKLQYDFEPDSFSVQGKRYSEYADGGEIKVNGMTKIDYVSAYDKRVAQAIRNAKKEGEYDADTFDSWQYIQEGSGFTANEIVGWYIDYKKFLSWWLQNLDNKKLTKLDIEVTKILCEFYFGKPMFVNISINTGGDLELAFEDELQKIKLLSNKIDFNKVVGVIDYEKTKNNTDLDFYKNIELVMSLNGDWDETTEELDTIIDVNGEMAYLNYHPLDSMGGVNMQQLKKNINEAFKELNTYSAVVSIEGYEEYAEDVEGLENAKSVIQNIKGNTRFQVLKGSSVGIGKRVDNSRVVEEYAKGGEAGFDDTGTSMVMYHEKKGNFFVAKDTVYLWFYNVENSAEKIESGEFDYVLYPFSSLGMMGQKGFIPPLKKIWTKKFQKKTKGSEHLLGVIKAFLIEEKGKKELYIDMMSVNPTKKKKGVMSYMIKDLRDTFDLTQEQITFSDLTDEGKKFLAKKTYDDGGGIGSNDEEKYNEYKKVSEKYQTILYKLFHYEYSDKGLYPYHKKESEQEFIVTYKRDNYTPRVYLKTTPQGIYLIRTDLSKNYLPSEYSIGIGSGSTGIGDDREEYSLPILTEKIPYNHTKNKLLVEKMFNGIAELYTKVELVVNIIEPMTLSNNRERIFPKDITDRFIRDIAENNNIELSYDEEDKIKEILNKKIFDSLLEDEYNRENTYADGGEAGYELENYIISGKNFKNKYATDFNGEVAKVIYTKNLDLGSNLGKGSYWNVTQDSLDIYSGERDEELDSKYGQYFKNTIYKKIDDNLKIFVKDEIADELWDNEKLYNKIKNISDGIYDPSYDDYGLLLFENQYADGGEASELNIGQIFEVNRDSEKGKKYFDFHYGKGYVFIISDIFNEKVIDENQFWDAHIKLKVYDSNLKYIFPIRVFFKGKPYGLNLTKKLFSELLSDKSIFPSDNYYVEKESDYDRQEREFKGNGYVELIKRKINPIWKSIIDKFSEIYFSNGTDNDYLVSDQVKARGSNPYSSYEFRNFSPLLSWADAEGKFKQSLTADELNSIEISYNTEEYADLEEHDTEKYHKQIVVKLKTYADGGDVENKIQLKNFSDLKQGDVIRKKEKLGTTIFVVNKSPVQSRIYKNEYDVLVTCIVSNTNFYKPFEEYYITSVIKYGKLGNVDYLGKWNYDDKIDYSIYLPKSNKKFADGGDIPHEDKMFQLPLEMVIYVPSTQDVDKVISIDDMILRVDEVKKYLANKFGGYTSADKLGGYVDSTGNLVNEDVVQVTSFSTKEAYAENKKELINQLAKWCDEWGQESIGFEFEGDLMYVPNKFKKGGRTKNM